MAKRVIPLFPWLLAEAPLAWTEAQFWPDGGLWLLSFWTVALLVYLDGPRPDLPSQPARRGRRGVRRNSASSRSSRAAWIPPAVVAFAACDAAGLTIELPPLPRRRRRLRARSGARLHGPRLGGARDRGERPDLQHGDDGGLGQRRGGEQPSGGGPAWGGAAGTDRTAPGWQRPRLGARRPRGRRPRADRPPLRLAGARRRPTALLVALVILGLPTLGLWLAPGGALALAAVRLGWPVQPSAGHP